MKRGIPAAFVIAILILAITPVATAATSADTVPDAGATTGTSESSALLASQRAQLTAADGAAGDTFGAALAVSADLAVIGTPNRDVGANTDQGCIYVYARSGTAWTQQAQLVASDGAAGDHFGSSIALVGETIIVGAPDDDVGASTDQGSASVFVRSGANWTQQAQLTAADGAPGDGFGCSVALSDASALIGANQDDVAANADQGSAYVFVRADGSWSQQAQLLASDGASNDRFGYGVALAGETALVGANRHDVGANADQGAAYLFARSGATWSQQQQLTAAEGAAGDRFGYAVGLAAESAVVGAPYDDLGSHADQGSATVFSRSASGWGRQQRLIAADGAADDLFGQAVALRDGVAVVGAYWHDVGAHLNQGSAYVFLGSAGDWSQHEQLSAAGGATNDRFGCAVALSETTVLVGAYWDDVATNVKQGSAYVFPPDGVAPVTTAQIVPAPNSGGWNAGPVTVQLQARDSFSGVAVAGTAYRAAGATDWTTYASPFVVSSSGLSWWEYRSTDATGNVEATQSLAVRIDDAAPISTVRLSPAANAYRWRKTATLTLNAKDTISWVSAIQYRLAGATSWTTYRWPFKLTRQGLATYEYRALDGADNPEAGKTLTVKLDSRKPTTKAFAATVQRGRTVRLRYRVLDALPGCGKAKATLKIYGGKKLIRTLKDGPSVSNVTRTCSWRCRIKPGRYTLKVYATDIAGNAQAKVGTAWLTVR
jgi:hypothetical protein